jgi:hypothetical protein
MNVTQLILIGGLTATLATGIALSVSADAAVAAPTSSSSSQVVSFTPSYRILTPLHPNSVAAARVASGIGCGAAECYVDSTVRGESNWEETIETGGTGSTGGGGGSGSSNSVTSYKACDGWLPAGGGTNTGKYPHENSGGYTCGFRDGGSLSGGNGVVLIDCPGAGDRAANGRVNVFHRDPATGKLTYKYFFCVYPTDAYAPIERNVGTGKVYTGGTGSFLSVSTTPIPAVSQYGGGGTIASTTGFVDRGVDLNNPEAYVGSWQPSFTAKTATKPNGDPVYGYYRLDWRLDYRLCEKWAYPSWLGVPARYDCAQQGSDLTAAPYTYACNFNPPLVEGVRTDAKFIPSECAPPWACTFSDDVTVGGQKTALSVMRNGENLGVRFPTPNVVGQNVRNPSQWKYKNDVAANATPSITYALASWKWNAWDDFKKEGTISFNWASENPDSPFKWTTSNRFTAQWLLPTQASIGRGTTYEWVTGNAECPQTHSSPAIQVMRATGR